MFLTVVLKVLALTLAFLSLARPAAAYLDPGTGSYFAQILIATLAGGTYLLVSSWGRVKGFLRGLIDRFSKRKDGNGR